MKYKGLTGCILAIVVFYFIYNGPFMLQLIENSLQFSIDCLTSIQSYVGDKRIEMMNRKMIEDSQQRKVFSTKNEEICPSYSYRIRIVNRKPLIIYIENFLNQKEINHLIELGEPLLKPSMINADQDGSEILSDYRTSTSAYIHRHRTHLIRCLEKRFAHFQGGLDVEQLEPFQIVKYVDNQQYKPHFDWFSEKDVTDNGGQRLSTFFTYLRSNCSKGETEFINVRFDTTLHQRFCDILVCDKKSSKHGLRFRPISGNSIFWYNMDEYGQADHLTHHAGLPPGIDSYKIGLNTWTRAHRFYWSPVD